MAKEMVCRLEKKTCVTPNQFSEYFRPQIFYGAKLTGSVNVNRALPGFSQDLPQKRDYLDRKYRLYCNTLGYNITRGGFVKTVGYRRTPADVFSGWDGFVDLAWSFRKDRVFVPRGVYKFKITPLFPN